MKSGRVLSLKNSHLEFTGAPAAVGELVHVQAGGRTARCLVQSFRDERRGKGGRPPLASATHTRVRCLLLDEPWGIRPGSPVLPSGRQLGIRGGAALLGRVLDALGEPIDGLGELAGETEYPLQAAPPVPSERAPVHQVFSTGVRVIDSVLTMGHGQRTLIASPAGVGFVTTLGMIVRNCEADVVVVGLIRPALEVQKFIQSDLMGNLGRCVMVTAEPSEPASRRLQLAWTVTALAESFRDQGQKVLLILDSLTELERADDQLGSADRFDFSALFARAGNTLKGSITALYSVALPEETPVPDVLRCRWTMKLDGRILLTEERARQDSVYPAVDVLQSVSLPATRLVGQKHLKLAGHLRQILAIHRANADILRIGAYQKGFNKELDRSLERIDACNSFLAQGVFERTEFDEMLAALSRAVKGDAGPAS